MTNFRKATRPTKYKKRYSRIANSTKKINTATQQRGGIKL